MADRERYRPFTGDADRKIRLGNAHPLLVVCQVRWPALTSLQTQGGFTRVAAAVAEHLQMYPLYEKSREAAVTITAAGVTTTEGDEVHRWRDVEGHWTVVLTTRSIALLSSRYADFGEFRDRLGPILEATGSVVDVPIVERIGLRHVNRVVSPEVLSLLPSALGKEVLGLASLQPASSDVQIVSSLNAALFAVGQFRLQARTGSLLPGETVDPSVEPIRDRSWILDLDSFSDAPTRFDAGQLLATAGVLADVNYDFFKLVATDEFVAAIDQEV